MKIKTKKPYLFAMALFFLTVFFVNTDSVSKVAKADCYGDYNVCYDNAADDVEAEQCYATYMNCNDTGSAATNTYSGPGGDMYAECMNSPGESASSCQGYYTDANGFDYASCNADGGLWENNECVEAGRATDCSQYGADYVADKNGNCVQVDTAGGNELCTTNAECITDFGAAYFCDQATRMCEERSADSTISTASGDICFTDSECPWYAKCKLGSNGATGICQGYTNTTDPQQKIDTLTNSGGTTPTIKTTQPVTLQNGSVAPAGTVVNSANGSGTNPQTGQTYPAGSFQVPSSGFDSSFVMCANGVLAQECRNSNGDLIGGTPVVLGSSSMGGLSGGGSGFVGPPSMNAKCGPGFEDIGGICFPLTTGLSDAPIYVILSNLFSWLMGLFTTFAVVAFVISGIQYFMASGDESMAKKAKENATHAVIGIIVGLSGFIIIKAIAAALSGQTMFF